jgi:Uma2 family endonuclease
MSTATRHTRRTHAVELSPQLVNGDRMSQAEFHRRYETYPEDVKFELIGGIVFMASPLRRTHGKIHIRLSTVLELYESQTPGVELLDNATTILGDASEPQPDLSLRILSEFGGRSLETTTDYVQGPPELVVEIAHSTRSIDLHLKRQDYEGAGVQEYLVLSVEEPELLWFDFSTKDSIKPDRRGLARSRTFPGLWINVPALLNNKREELLATMSRGLKSPAHRAFVKMLQARRRSKS